MKGFAILTIVSILLNALGFFIGVCLDKIEKDWANNTMMFLLKWVMMPVIGLFIFSLLGLGMAVIAWLSGTAM